MPRPPVRDLRTEGTITCGSEQFEGLLAEQGDRSRAQRFGGKIMAVGTVPLDAGE